MPRQNGTTTPPTTPGRAEAPPHRAAPVWTCEDYIVNLLRAPPSYRKHQQHHQRRDSACTHHEALVHVSLSLLTPPRNLSLSLYPLTRLNACSPLPLGRRQATQPTRASAHGPANLLLPVQTGAPHSQRAQRSQPSGPSKEEGGGERALRCTEGCASALALTQVLRGAGGGQGCRAAAGGCCQRPGEGHKFTPTPGTTRGGRARPPDLMKGWMQEREGKGAPRRGMGVRAQWRWGQDQGRALLECMESTTIRRLTQTRRQDINVCSRPTRPLRGRGAASGRRDGRWEQEADEDGAFWCVCRMAGAEGEQQFVRGDAPPCLEPPGAALARVRACVRACVHRKARW